MPPNVLTYTGTVHLYSILKNEQKRNNEKNPLFTKRNFVIPPSGHSAANAALVSFRLLQLIPKNPPPHSLKRPQMVSTLPDTLPHFLWILLSSLSGFLPSLLFLHLLISLLLLLQLSKKS